MKMKKKPSWKPTLGTFSKATEGSIALNFSESGEVGFTNLCHAYKAQIQKRLAKGDVIPWIRFSTFGSVPNRKLTPDELEAFADMVQSFPAGVPVHFPVETREKADRFRAIAVAFDLDLVIRESCQSDARMRSGDNTGQSSRMAKQLPDARVCPAIASTILRRPKPIKCGQCTLCAQSQIKTILYPQH